MINPMVGPPLNLQANVMNSTNVSLTWSPPTMTMGLTGYKVYRDNTLLATIDNSSTTTYSDTPEPGNHTYYVTAMFGTSESTQSNTSTITIASTLEGPANLQSTVISANNVILTWSAPSNISGLTSYKVYRDGTLIQTIIPPETSTIDTPSMGDHTYFVTAMFGTSESIQSNMINVHISAIIGAPSNLQAVVNAPHVNLTWSTPAETAGMTSYKIYRNNALIMEITPATVTSYTDSPSISGNYSYYVTAMFGTTESSTSNVATIDVTANEDGIQTPYVTALNDNYPNPFNPETNISFSLAKSKYANLLIYNFNGQKVRELVHGNMTAGQHIVSWNGTDNNGNKVASGFYFYKLVTDDKTITKKMIMLK
jgi:hypothetical protein